MFSNFNDKEQDIPTLERLISQLDDTMKFAITTDGHAKVLSLLFPSLLFVMLTWSKVVG